MFFVYLEYMLQYSIIYALIVPNIFQAIEQNKLYSSVKIVPNIKFTEIKLYVIDKKKEVIYFITTLSSNADYIFFIA